MGKHYLAYMVKVKIWYQTPFKYVYWCFFSSDCIFSAKWALFQETWNIIGSVEDKRKIFRVSEKTNCWSKLIPVCCKLTFFDMFNNFKVFLQSLIKIKTNLVALKFQIYWLCISTILHTVFPVKDNKTQIISTL